MSLDRDLMREAKKRAIDLGMPLYQFVEGSLRQSLSHQLKVSSAVEEAQSKADERDAAGHQS